MNSGAFHDVGILPAMPSYKALRHVRKEENGMLSYEEWNARIDAFLLDEKKNAGHVFPVCRINCQDDTDRSGGGIYNETVTADTIGRFARALGDSNPLYSDPRYARKSPFSGIIAPPLFESCICSTFIGGRFPRLRGIQVFDAGTKWERFACIRPGDSFRAETTFLGTTEISREDHGSQGTEETGREDHGIQGTEETGRENPGSQGTEVTGREDHGSQGMQETGGIGPEGEFHERKSRDRFLIREHAIDLFNGRGEHVSRLTARTMIKCTAPGEGPTDISQPEAAQTGSSPHVETDRLRPASAGEGSGQPRQTETGRPRPASAGEGSGRPRQTETGRPRYTEAELERVYENLDAQLAGEFRRGGLPRYWEDVKIGEELPEQIVGPYDESDGHALMAAIGVSSAFAVKRGAIRRGKGAGVIDPETGARRLPIDRHNSDVIARAQGLPRAIVSGIHSQALLAKSAGDWMGDHGMLRSLDCRCKKPLYFGDLSIQRGIVTGKFEAEGCFYARLHLEAVRQDGVVHTEADAVIELPASRSVSSSGGLLPVLESERALSVDTGGPAAAGS